MTKILWILILVGVAILIGMTLMKSCEHDS